MTEQLKSKALYNESKPLTRFLVKSNVEMSVRHRCSSCGKELPTEHSSKPNYLCSKCFNKSKTEFGEGN